MDYFQTVTITALNNFIEWHYDLSGYTVVNCRNCKNLKQVLVDNTPGNNFHHFVILVVTFAVTVNINIAEKHKTYHIKDEQLIKDGFKKFMKQEACPYEGCKFSLVVNHIHCIRPDCNYVLHSSGQIFAHKVHIRIHLTRLATSGRL